MYPVILIFTIMANKKSAKLRVIDPQVKPTWYDSNLCTIGRIQDVLVNFACCCNEVIDDDDELVKDVSSVLLRINAAAFKKFPINI